MEPRTGPDYLPRRQLIVLGSGVTALAVVRAAYHLGVSSVVVDNRSGVAMASRLAHADVHAALRTTGLVPRIRELAQRAPSSLLATSDVWLRAIVAHRAELSVSGMDILHPDNARLEICMDKSRFAAWCEQNWLPAPRPYPVKADLRPELDHSATLQDLAPCFDGYPRAGAVPIVGEPLLGRRMQQFSVGAAVSAPTMVTVVTRKLRPPPDACAVGSLVEAMEQPDVERLAQRALLALDYHGIAEVEILRDEDSGEVFLIEVNPRPWLQFAIAAARGTDLLAFVLERRTSARSSPHGARPPPAPGRGPCGSTFATTCACASVLAGSSARVVSDSAPTFDRSRARTCSRAGRSAILCRPGQTSAPCCGAR
jgi:predicted ATP-grasp superfamily ATP-dependent carboligase